MYVVKKKSCVILLWIRYIKMGFLIDVSNVKKKLKEYTDTWKNKKVGLMFIVQYAHYSEYV